MEGLKVDDDDVKCKKKESKIIFHELTMSDGLREPHLNFDVCFIELFDFFDRFCVG